MNNETRNYWKLGMFTIIGITLLLGTLFYIGKHSNMFSNVIRLQSVFTNVNGLKPGSNVRLAGIVIGTVEKIDLISDSTVLVSVVVQDYVKNFIKKNAIASIGSDGLMGERVFVITPGSNKQAAIRDADMLASAQPISMDAIISSLKLSADHILIITDQLAQITYKVNHSKGMLSKIIGDTTFANNISTTMNNLKKSSVGLKENMEAAKSNFLLRSYFKRKKRKEEKAAKEAAAEQEHKKN